MSTTVQPIDDLCINTIRTLSIDAVQKANSAIRECRWARRRWRTSCGRAISGTIPPTPNGPIAIGSSCRRDTPAC